MRWEVKWSEAIDSERAVAMATGGRDQAQFPIPRF